MTEAIEMTSFRLAKGLTIKDFITANDDIDAWLNKQQGFISRHICENDDGTIVDVLFWASVADGHRAASGVVTEMAGSPVHSAIDQSTVSWSIANIRAQLQR